MANFGHAMDFMSAGARQVPGMHQLAHQGNGHYDEPHEDNHHLVSKSQQEQFERMLDALHGGTPNAVLSWIMLVVSIGITIFAVFWHKLSAFQQVFALLAMSILITQSFAMVELLANLTVRNIHEMAGSKGLGGGGSQNDYKKFAFMGTDFAGGSEFYQLLVPFGLFSAFVAFVWGMLSMPDAVTGSKDMTPDKLLLLLAVVSNTTAALNLASVMRDQFDADAWSDHHQDSAFNLIELHTESCIALCMKGLENRRMLYAAALFASCCGIVGAIANFGGVHHGLGMCLVGSVALMASTWKLSLIVEDEDDDPENNEIGVSVCVALVALGITLYGLYAMPMITDQDFDTKLTMFAGIISATQAAFCISKATHKEKRLAHYLPHRPVGNDSEEDE